MSIDDILYHIIISLDKNNIWSYKEKDIRWAMKKYALAQQIEENKIMLIKNEEHLTKWGIIFIKKRIMDLEEQFSKL